MEMRKLLVLVLLVTLTAPQMLHSQESVIPREPRLYYGFQVKEGINWLLCQVEYKDAYSLVGRRFHPSYSAFLEIGNWYEYKNIFYGLGVEIQYSWRGGKITNKLTNPPAEVMLDYLDFRLGYIGRTKGNGFFRIGAELSVLQNATYKDEIYPFSHVESEVTSKALGLWFEGGGLIGKHFLMSFYIDWLFWRA